MDSVIVQKVLDFVGENIWLPLILIGVFGYVLGYISKYFLDRKKTKVEIEDRQENIQKQKLDTAERLLSYKEKYEVNSENISTILTKFISATSERNFDLVNEYREEGLKFFFHDFIKSFMNYFEMSKKIIDEKENKEFVEVQIIPFLETVNKFLDTLNLDVFLNKLNKSKANLNKSTLQPLFTFSDKFKSGIERDSKEKYEQLQTKLN